MELGGEDVARPHARREPAAVLGGGGDDARVGRDGIVGVHEIDAGVVGHVRQVRGPAFQPELVPAHVRNFLAAEPGRVEAHDRALQDVEAGYPAELDTLGKENLHSHADAEKRGAAPDDAMHGLDQAALGQALHTRRERAHTGQHHARGRLDSGRVARHGRGEAHFLEALVDAPQIAHAVVDDRDHGCVSSTMSAKTATSPRVLMFGPRQQRQVAVVTGGPWWTARRARAGRAGRHCSMRARTP